MAQLIKSYRRPSPSCLPPISPNVWGIFTHHGSCQFQSCSCLGWSGWSGWNELLYLIYMCSHVDNTFYLWKCITGVCMDFSIAFVGWREFLQRTLQITWHKSVDSRKFKDQIAFNTLLTGVFLQHEWHGEGYSLWCPSPLRSRELLRRFIEMMRSDRPVGKVTE